MCGIAGIISSEASEKDLKAMLKKQVHRGPDYTGIFIDEGFAALGHNRLAIIDLSPDANQPFTDISGRYQLTFNGEIYNYKELKEELKNSYHFKTTSDTEVLLAAYIKWGKKCLDKFIGMFAFTIWDIKEKSLFAARDRFGVKPFFYTQENGFLYFSSEIKAIRSVLKRNLPNEKVWATYFTYGSYGLPDETFFEDIHQLPGGHFLTFSNEKLVIKKWYNFTEAVSKIDTKNSFEEAKNIYLSLLKDSIALRFRADVPLGFNISGGVDSSLLLALVNEFEDKKRINAYTFYTGDLKYDELPWVEKMISTTKNPLTSVKFVAREVENSAKLIAEIQDEPFGGIPTLAYSKIFEQAQKDGIKVLLDGQGMDEQWAGYDYYLPKTDSQNIIQGVGNNSPYKPNVLTDKLRLLAEKPSYPQLFDNNLQNKQFRDLFYTKIPRALRFNDRISMAYSTELREPFLDHRLVEFAFAQPPEFKIHHRVQKYMLREILKSVAPQDISFAPKRPLQTPQREWLGEELKEWVESNLANLKDLDWFDNNQIEKEWQAYLVGNQESSFHIWQLVNAAMLLK
ncbi:asparagine synthase (glutamine-hydrolysing) [Gillisia sp. Hel_I_86]|uniref:asparagine synthase (glutamine-hydrolyzing) n=1 Tax=Gillisia sp. Hel_I_86 TaxID=1249981 RepID=UPI00119AC07B|nr:asparagine synthase (glutamine-hydrolyzing) [Gillisia sp. Hel_I_86]TVZ25595.1 asparagine synthase (glutamine-hydrolysing) [Gillisia sp. Hel_I_86]